MVLHYEKFGEVSAELCAQAAAIAHKHDDWQIGKRAGRYDYAVTMAGKEDLEQLTELSDIWPVDLWQGFRFVKIEPGGYIHRHKDGNEAYWRSFHVVLRTNDQCISSMYDDDGEHQFHLEAGSIWEIDRVCEHGSTNSGDTERLHLLMEVNDECPSRTA